MSVEQANNLYELPERFERLSRSMAEMLSQLIKEANELVARTEGHRKRVFADLHALLEEVPEPDQGVVLSRLEHEVQRVLDEQGSPKVSVSGGKDACLGRPGGRVDATEGGTTVGVCGIIQGGELVGGGVQVETTC
jgi:hypothetical protein